MKYAGYAPGQTTSLQTTKAMPESVAALTGKQTFSVNYLLI